MFIRLCYKHVWTVPYLLCPQQANPISEQVKNIQKNQNGIGSSAKIAFHLAQFTVKLKHVI